MTINTVPSILFYLLFTEQMKQGVMSGTIKLMEVPTPVSVAFERGVLSLNGHPQFLLSADYPYYRDDVANWRPRLQQLKGLGISSVTFYVPWRHHEVGSGFDFTGRTQPNRNVVHFLELIQQEGLMAIVKPGPFIHAETDFSGLPDEVAGGERYEPMLDSDGNPRPWHRDLPAPLAAPFMERALGYFEACLAQLIEPFIYPRGPIYALQVLNEGVYSEGNRWLTAYDYSASSLAEYRRRFWPPAAGSRPTRFRRSSRTCSGAAGRATTWPNSTSGMGGRSLGPACRS